MKVAVFDTHSCDRTALETENSRTRHHNLTFFSERLKLEAAPLAVAHKAVCVFVNDRLDPKTLKIFIHLASGLLPHDTRATIKSISLPPNRV